MKKTLKKMLAVLICGVMIFVLLPTAVFAENLISYSLHLGDIEVTSQKLSGTGWSYDPDTSTLTLNNFTLNKPYETVTGTYYGIQAFNPLTICLIGKNTITMSRNDEVNEFIGIQFFNHLQFTGTGSLTIAPKLESVKKCSGISGTFYNCTVDGCTLNVQNCDSTDKNVAIQSNSLILKNKANVQAIAGSSAFSDSYGIFLSSYSYIDPIGTLNINNATLKAAAGAAHYSYTGIDTVSCGIDAQAIIADNATVTATGAAAGKTSYGIQSKSVSFKNSTVTVSADYAEKNIALKTTDGCTVDHSKLTVTGKSAKESNGMIAENGNIDVIAGNITASAKNAVSSATALACNNGTLTVTSGTVCATSYSASQSVAMNAPAGKLLIKGGIFVLSGAGQALGCNPVLSDYTKKTNVKLNVSTSKNANGNDAKATSVDSDLTTFKYVKIMPTLKAPVLKTATNHSKGVQIEWEAVSGAESYRVFRKVKGGSWTKVGLTDSLLIIDQTAQSGQTYIYTVRCASTDGTYYTSTYDTNGLTRYYIACPKISSLTNAASGMTVTWSKESKADKYVLYRKTSNTSWGKKATLSAKNLSYTDKTAKNGILYYYTLRAQNSKGLSAACASQKYVHLRQPMISSLKNTSSKTMIAQWGKNSSATGYQICYKIGTKAVKSLTISGASTLSKAIGSLTKGTTYNVYVRSYAKVSGVNYYSAWSAKKSLKIAK